MTAEEVRLRLHALIDELPEDTLLALQQQLEEADDPQKRQQLLAKIINEDAALLKRLGR